MSWSLGLGSPNWLYGQEYKEQENRTNSHTYDTISVKSKSVKIGKLRDFTCVTWIWDAM